ncbi:hypothetical protein CHLNCDRAFT_142828 [Chlorella variabilis]|uniref:C2 domain-containing protein n=1 Tax=Chlorella variabilis TaxID=554065 RepID=E1Z8U8_CHLVA|nr:hypothetical protein CHLNCDRAFT_142828 [Chlorella variabilis]EFN57401.1 hypothetical protein CHLNCDRAFT_142828 [Chlorella variabilis]|eukprot:XP_005849503.1 hypothetical protein CHLNCDRAFT_142828 [Chlorella variabilis]
MGCVNSVQDKHAIGTLPVNSANGVNGIGATSGHWESEAAAAVAELLGPSTSVRVEVSIKCRGLPDMDTFSKSDPMAVLLEADSPSTNRWAEVERSDVVANNLNPDFPKPLVCSYNFEKLQPMKLVVYDVDAGTTDPAAVKLADSDFLAEGEFLLSDVFTAQGQTLTIQLKDKLGRPIPRCVAVLSGEELPMTNAVVSLSLAASNLDNVETWSKSDPFVRISKMRESGEWVIPNNLNPVWRPFQASMAQLCNGDAHRPLLFEVFDAEANGSHKFIGSWQGSLTALQDASQQGRGLPLVNPTKAKPGYVSSGTLLAKGVTITARPSFLDYIKGGMALNFLCAIDFTASNGSPNDPTSLHFLGRGKSVYERAIAAVGSVIEHYDTTKRFPAFGFGAALPPSGTANHCFPLNGVPSSPETVKSVRLSGPTLFAPVISAAAQIAAQPSSHLHYYVLLIITDGCIMDMQNTLQAIVDASVLPLSLLIVGVGDDDFSAMEVLDGDDHRIRAPSGRLAARDCVQFVPFRNGVQVGGGRHAQRDAVEELASQLLAELPGQVVEHFFDHRKIPPPTRASAPPPPAVAADGY